MADIEMIKTLLTFCKENQIKTIDGITKVLVEAGIGNVQAYSDLTQVILDKYARGIHINDSVYVITQVSKDTFVPVKYTVLSAVIVLHQFSRPIVSLCLDDDKQYTVTSYEIFKTENDCKYAANALTKAYKEREPKRK